jgi:hypothetical protein
MCDNKAVNVDFAALPTTDPGQITEEGRQAILQQVMDKHQVVADAWSKADFPHAGDEAVIEHERQEQELINLVGRVLHLPDSVEGVRFLERWFNARTDTLKQVAESTKAGTVVQLDDGSAPVELNEDMAKGMQLGLLAARALFDKFPISMTVSETEPG